MRCLSAAGVETYLFGGWAEELLGLCPPRPHHDVDLLYPAEDFSLVDNFLLDGQPEIEEVAAKRFVHKRAFIYGGVMVEILLLKPDASGYTTTFFDRYSFYWPADTLSGITLDGKPLRLASAAALSKYRDEHSKVDDARRHFFRANEETPPDD